MKKVTNIFFIVIVVLGACKQVNKQTSENIPDVDSTYLEQLNKEALTEIYHRFPSPDEMISVINEQKPPYISGILNSDKNAKKYLDSRSQALNFGVYVADLAYLTYYQKHKESVGYLDAIYFLSDELQIASAFHEDLVNRIQHNITNADSLKVLADVAVSTITNYLIANKKEETFAVISIGGFVETMFLSIKIATDFSENNVIIQRIADQKLVLNNILKYSAQFNSPAIENAQKLLINIKSVFDSLEVEKIPTEVVKQDGKLIIKGGDRLVITEEQFTRLKEYVAEARNSITQY
jgi:hypothetical protein